MKKSTYFQILDIFSDLLYVTGAFESQNERRFWRRIDGTLSDHQVLEVQATVKNQKEQKISRYIPHWD